MTLVSATARINRFPEFAVGNPTTGRRLDNQLAPDLDDAPALWCRFDPHTNTVRSDNQWNAGGQPQRIPDGLRDHDSTSTVDGNCHAIDSTIALLGSSECT